MVAIVIPSGHVSNFRRPEPRPRPRQKSALPKSIRTMLSTGHRSLIRPPHWPNHRLQGKIAFATAAENGSVNRRLSPVWQWLSEPRSCCWRPRSRRKSSFPAMVMSCSRVQSVVGVVGLPDRVAREETVHPGPDRGLPTRETQRLPGKLISMFQTATEPHAPCWRAVSRHGERHTNC